MRLARILGIVVVLVALSSALPLPTAQAASLEGSFSITLGCDSFTSSGSAAVRSTRNNTGAGFESISVTVTDGNGRVLYQEMVFVALGDTVSLNAGTFAYGRAPLTNPITFRLVSDAGNGLAEAALYITSADCGSLPLGSGTLGCDILYPLPETAVVGQFLTNVEAEWAPGHGTGIILEAGKTAWVLGVNDAGTHWKIFFGCTELWVPVGTMGANFDDTWQGRPLPGGIFVD